MIAARYGIVTVVELLLQKGADPTAINEVSTYIDWPLAMLM
jgi:hypothetical protein